MEYLIAFLVGGAVCAGVQVLMDQTKLQPGRIMVLLVCSGAVLSALGIYGPFKEWAGAGASIPLTGFGHTLFEGVKKAVEEDGFLGVFKGGFTASAVGISAALVFAYFASHIFKSRMKDS
jgi:stage V sporulation protein AE